MFYKNRLVDNSYLKEERPYFCLEDNIKSSQRISRIKSFNSVDKLKNNDELNLILVRENYFDNEFLSKIKNEAINYPQLKQ